MADMIVSGAEYSAANGTYVESGSDGGKPRYVHESNSDYVIFWHNLDAIWYVCDATNLTWAYYSLSQVATPDLCLNWADALTFESSALTVTSASSSQNLTSQSVTSESSVSSPVLAEFLSGTVDETYVLSAQYFGKFYWPFSFMPEVADADTTDDLTATNVESASSVSKPELAQVHALASQNVTSESSVSEPTIGQVHALTSQNVISESSVSKSSTGGEANLTSSNVESASSVSKPTLGQAHVLTSTNVTATSEVSKPTIGQGHALTSSNVESGASVSKPALGQVHNLTSQNVTSESSVNKPTLVLVIALTSQNVEAGSSVSMPTLTSADFLFAEIWDGSVRLIITVDGNVVLNKEVNAGVIMNQEITDTYSELEAI